MPRRNRGYKKGEPFRDSNLFVISCEGAKREVGYFKALTQGMRRVRVEILHPGKLEDSGSDPRSVLDRAVRYVEQNDISDGDEFWLVIDRDRWEDKMIREVISHCQDHPGWDIAISNPCFEVWLLFHRTKDFYYPSATCKDYKRILNDQTPMGYAPESYVPLNKIACRNAKDADGNPGHPFANPGTSKIYLMMESLKKARPN